MVAFAGWGGVLHGPKLAEGGSSCVFWYGGSGSGLIGIDLELTAISETAAFGGEWLMMAGSSAGDDMLGM